MTWKTERRHMLVELLRVWHSDENAIVREKVRRSSTGRIAGPLAQILREGRDSGHFAIPDPQLAATVVISLVLAMADVLGEHILDHHGGDEDHARQVLSVARAYSEGLERVLGAEPGSLTIADEAMLRIWLA
jgi:hypothetical protein